MFPSSDDIAGCEIDVICDPKFDESAFAGLLGKELQSIVRNQPTISELVNGSMKMPKFDIHSSRSQGIAEMIDIMQINQAAQNVDFDHLQAQEPRFQPSIEETPLPGTRKRKSPFEDGFSDIDVDDFELNEDDVRQLDSIQSPEKLPNGKYKCSHLCKDRKRYTPALTCLNVVRCRHLCCKEGRVSTKTKFRVSTSKLKKTSFQRSKQFLLKTSGDKGREQNNPQASVELRSSHAEAQLGLSAHRKGFSVGNKTYQAEENLHSVFNSDLGDISELVRVPVSAASYCSVSKSEQIRSEQTDACKGLGTGLHGGLSFNENGVIANVSDDELPHPRDLLPKPRPSLRIFGVGNDITPSTTGLTSVDCDLENGGNRGEFNIGMRTSKLNNVFTGFAFSIDDILGCVEIV
jgi:hypothetical protein